jgi:hypothetical protein
MSNHMSGVWDLGTKWALDCPLKCYAEAGALDGEHESFYRRCCQLVEVKREEGLTP